MSDVRTSLGLPPVSAAIEKRFGPPTYTEQQVLAFAANTLADLSAARLRVKALEIEARTLRQALELTPAALTHLQNIDPMATTGIIIRTVRAALSSAQGETKPADRYQEGYGAGYEQGTFDAVQSRDVPEDLPESPSADVGTLAPDPAHLREAALYLLKGVNVGSGSFGFYHGTRFVKLTATYLKDEPTVGATAAIAGCPLCSGAEFSDAACPICGFTPPDAAALVEGE